MYLVSIPLNIQTEIENRWYLCYVQATPMECFGICGGGFSMGKVRDRVHIFWKKEWKCSIAEIYCEINQKEKKRKKGVISHRWGNLAKARSSIDGGFQLFFLLDKVAAQSIENQQNFLDHHCHLTLISSSLQRILMQNYIKANNSEVWIFYYCYYYYYFFSSNWCLREHVIIWGISLLGLVKSISSERYQAVISINMVGKNFHNS